MGLDEANLIRIKTDNNGSIDIQNLRKTIDRCFINNKKIFLEKESLNKFILLLFKEN